MASNPSKTVDLRTRSAWRKWLAANHASVDEIWLVFHKTHTDVASVAYDDAVEEALCFGWIDSLIRRLDEDRYARKFTPRKPDSRWSTANRRRYESARKKGILTAAGEARPPTDRSGDAPKVSGTKIPAYIEAAFRSDAKAWAFFESLAPSHRRTYIGWIDSAKREETKQKRIAEVLARPRAGQKPGLK